MRRVWHDGASLAQDEVVPSVNARATKAIRFFLFIVVISESLGCGGCADHDPAGSHRVSVLKSIVGNET